MFVNSLLNQKKRNETKLLIFFSELTKKKLTDFFSLATGYCFGFSKVNDPFTEKSTKTKTEKTETENDLDFNGFFQVKKLIFETKKLSSFRIDCPHPHHQWLTIH